MSAVYAPISAYLYIDSESGPIISLFCMSSDGQSCCVNVKGFVPYFYLKMPHNPNISSESMQGRLKTVINELNKSVYLKLSKEKFMKNKNGLYFDKNKDIDMPHCKRVISERFTNEYNKEISIPKLFFVRDIHYKKSFNGYKKDAEAMLRVDCRLPYLVGEARRLLAAPLGTGFSSVQKKGSGPPPWVDIPLICGIKGMSFEEACKFALVSDGSVKIDHKRKRGCNDNHNILELMKGKKQTTEAFSSSSNTPGTSQEDWAFHTCESNIDYIMRFFVDRDIPPFGWFSLANATLRDKKSKNSTFIEEYDCHVDDIVPDKTIKRIPPIKVMSFDIETQPSEKNGSVTQFYKGWDLTAKLLTIGTCIHVTGTSESQWTTEVHQLDEPGGDSPHTPKGAHIEYYTMVDEEDREGTPDYAFNHLHEGVQVRFFGYRTETDLFLGFLKRFYEHMPQVLTGWNINGYDYEQMEQISCRLTMIECRKNLGDDSKATDVLRCVDEYFGGEWVNNEESNFKKFYKTLNELCIKDPKYWKLNIMNKWKTLNFKKGGGKSLLPGNYKEKHIKATNTVRYKMYGIWSLDLYVYVSKELKLRSYKLDYVAKEILKSQKDEMPYSEINSAYNSQGFSGRLKLAMYCAIDCVLVNRLMESKKIQALNKIIFMCMLTNVLPEDLHWKGTQNQLRGAILKYLKDFSNDFVLPVTDDYYIPTWDENYESEDEEEVGGKRKKPGYQGATVIDAKAGFYISPVAVFDFASLYPSNIRELNLCNSAIIWKEEDISKEGLTHEDVITQRIGDQTVYYVKKEIFQGVIPSLLAQLKVARSGAKKEMEAVDEDAPEHAYWDGLQASVKVLMNGMYGSFGLKKGGIFKDGYINAALTTQRGRELIFTVKEECERMFWSHPDGRYGIGLERPEGSTPVDGIYGDTDSVFILVRNLDLKTAWAFAADMDKHFENMMPYPHQLELEKICYPLLLMKKKTYSAVMYTGPQHKGKTVAKGSSVVRRDQVACIQKVTQQVQDMLMRMESKESIEEFVRRKKMELVNSIRNMWVSGESTCNNSTEFELETFVESGSLSADKPLHMYADGATCAVEVIRRIQKKNPEEVPEGGARVEFVIVKDDTIPLVTKRARTVEEVREYKMILDESHYTEVFNKKISSILSAAYIQDEHEERRKKGSRTIDSFFGSADKTKIVPLMPKKKSDLQKEGGKNYVEKNVLGKVDAPKNEISYQNVYDRKQRKWIRVIK